MQLLDHMEHNKINPQVPKVNCQCCAYVHKPMMEWCWTCRIIFSSIVRMVTLTCKLVQLWTLNSVPVYLWSLRMLPLSAIIILLYFDLLTYGSPSKVINFNHFHLNRTPHQQICLSGWQACTRNSTMVAPIRTFASSWRGSSPTDPRCSSRMQSTGCLVSLSWSLGATLEVWEFTILSSTSWSQCCRGQLLQF